jgi:hypothetical protein
MGSEGARLKTEAPLSQWFNHGSFDSATQCKETQRSLELEVLKEILDLAKKEGCPDDRQLRKCAGTSPMFAEYGALFAGQCIASDDPRLKGD